MKIQAPPLSISQKHQSTLTKHCANWNPRCSQKRPHSTPDPPSRTAKVRSELKQPRQMVRLRKVCHFPFRSNSRTRHCACYWLLKGWVQHMGRVKKDRRQRDRCRHRSKQSSKAVWMPLLKVPHEAEYHSAHCYKYRIPFYHRCAVFYIRRHRSAPARLANYVLVLHVRNGRNGPTNSSSERRRRSRHPALIPKWLDTHWRIVERQKRYKYGLKV